MAFFNSAVEVLQTLVVALGAGLGVRMAVGEAAGVVPGAFAVVEAFDEGERGVPVPPRGAAAGNAGHELQRGAGTGEK